MLPAALHFHRGLEIMKYGERNFEAETGKVLERQLGDNASQTQAWGKGLQIWDMKSWCRGRETRMGPKS